MQYKKFFSAAALVTLLSVSNYLSADPMGSEDGGETSYYVRGQYNGEFFTNMMGLTGKETAANATSANAGKFQGKKSSSDATANDYGSSQYTPSFIGGGVEFGYKMDDIRVGIEGLYSQVNVVNEAWAKYAELVRNLEGGDKTASTTADQDNGLSAFDPKTTAFKVTSADNLKAIAGLLNAYYDIDLGSDIPVVPYIGIGAGVAYVSNPITDAKAGDTKNTFGVAYQVKAGVSYALIPEIKLYAGARYFGVYGAEFKGVSPDQVIAAGSVVSSGKARIASDKADVKRNHDVYGVEAGVMFNF